MKLLLIEETADGLADLAVRATRAGHDVRYHLGSYDQHRQPVGRGLVERAHDWRPSMRWCDLCVVGGNGKWMLELDRWRASGVPMIGGNCAAAAWELDRMAGMQVFRRAGIPVPPYRQCATIDEALAYAAAHDTGLAAKPCGSVSDKSSSFVGKSGRDVVWRLQRWKRENRRFPEGLILQDLVKGVEFAAGGWVGPGGFAEGWEENFEFKKLFPGDLGPNTGEQGTVMRLTKRSKLAEKVLAPFEDRLVALGYVGNVDVNCIVDEDGTPWPLEWTMRLGWPAFNIETALHQGDPVEFLAGLAGGKTPKTRALDTVAVGVVMAIPPYPMGHEKPEEVVGVPIWGATPGIEDNLHLCMAQLGEGPALADGKIGKRPVLATAGSYVLVSTGTGETVTAASREAYRVLNRLTVSGAFWRNDIGSRLRGQIDALNEHGYASRLRYA